MYQLVAWKASFQAEQILYLFPDIFQKLRGIK